MREVIKLPYPPTVNHYKRLGGLRRTTSGKLYQPRVNTEATKQYIASVWALLHHQKIPSFGKARLEMHLFVYAPDHRKRDLDGILKVLLDALQVGGLYEDDNQIDRLLVVRCAPKPPEGEIIAWVWSLDQK